VAYDEVEMYRWLPLILMSSLIAQTSPDLSKLKQMVARFTPAEMRVDVSALSAGDRQALSKLIEAARLYNGIFMRQLWSGNLALYHQLQSDHTPLGRERLHYFLLNKSPWSEIDEHAAFIPGVPARKPAGANFYPEDMSRQEFEAWTKTLSPTDKQATEGFFTVIRRDAQKHLQAIPYSVEYRDDLARAANLLEQAAGLTTNPTLKRFLLTRGAAFLSNDYYESDLAWMDLDAPVDITIGPYETYNDEMFGYKAGFEVYVNLRDEKETAKLDFFASHLQEIEDHLPIDAKYRNPKLGAQAPIRVVNEVFAAGDGSHGVQTAAYNLPNDERVITQKGSKRVMLRNVQQAKFDKTLTPIARRVLPAESQADLSFDAFFTHILAHEMSHGIGPHQIGASGNVRQALKELYSALEEAKADITGLFMLQYMYDHKLLPATERSERQMYTTFLASTFRSLRFGLQDAHARGMALQVNYLTRKGGFVASPDGTFAIDWNKIKPAVRDLTHDILTLEATGDYAGTKKMLDELGSVSPAMRQSLDRLSDIPVDIEPIFVTADELSPAQK
jgi:Peptidase family M49